MDPILANPSLEAAVIFVICGVFLALFIVAGVRQAVQRRKKQ